MQEDRKSLHSAILKYLLGLRLELFFTSLDTALNTKSTGNFAKMDIALNSGRIQCERAEKKIVMSPQIPQSIQSARLSLQSSELAPSPPDPQASVVLSPCGSGGGTHSLVGEGAGGANSDEGTDTMHCSLGIGYYNPSTPMPHLLTMPYSVIYQQVQ
jgi:hypothetical protein